jgi:hypothetical protein
MGIDTKLQATEVALGILSLMATSIGAYLTWRASGMQPVLYHLTLDLTEDLCSDELTRRERLRRMHELPMYTRRLQPANNGNIRVPVLTANGGQRYLGYLNALLRDLGVGAVS